MNNISAEGCLYLSKTHWPDLEVIHLSKRTYSF